MNMYKEVILEILGQIEKSPGTFVYLKDSLHKKYSHDYDSVCNFITGYFWAFENPGELHGRSLNLEFCHWLSHKYGQNSMVWSGYIYHLLADKDDDLAFKLVFKNLKMWLAEQEDF